MLRPGENVDSWCGTCKLILAHTIEAMVGEKPARVCCNTCKGQHSYKAKQPGTAVKRVPRAAGTAAPRRTAPRATAYQKLMNGKDMALIRPYSPQDSYASGDVLAHSTFGNGVVTELRSGGKMEVSFDGGVKLLVHGR